MAKLRMVVVAFFVVVALAGYLGVGSLPVAVRSSLYDPSAGRELGWVAQVSKLTLSGLMLMLALYVARLRLLVVARQPGKA